MADGSSWSSALNNLTNLRSLQLSMIDIESKATANSCLQEVARLSQLTQLKLNDAPYKSNMHLLPAQLERLELHYPSFRDDDPPEGVTADLQHLTSLRHLKLTASDFLAADTSLPCNLHELELNAAWRTGVLDSLSSLQQVTTIQLQNTCITRDHLRLLEQLPQLKTLSLVVHSDRDLLHVAAAWHKLPLHSLYVCPESMTAVELQHLMQHVAAANGLKELVMNIPTLRLNDDQDDDEDLDHSLRICQHLKQLTSLQHLNLDIGQDPGLFAEQDAQQLSALVTLTSLTLACHGGGPYVDAATASLLAVTLTNLKLLWLDCYKVRNEHRSVDLSVLPALGRLTTLQSLQLEGFSAGHAQRGLQFLTGLVHLTQLSGFDKAGDAAMDEFWACIAAQKSKLHVAL